jgi:hypothetical protein
MNVMDIKVSKNHNERIWKMCTPVWSTPFQPCFICKYPFNRPTDSELCPRFLSLGNNLSKSCIIDLDVRYSELQCVRLGGR